MAENTKSKARYRPDPQILTLGGETGAPFYDPVEPAAFPKHVLRYRNQRWAARVGLDALTDAEWTDHFGLFHPLTDNLEQPLALRYHGHQFRVYNPDIGDGRGFLFAQLRDGAREKGGRLLDLSTKGSGQTPYSRFGDGRLTLKGGVRELLATEMLEALGVYTSKTFSLIETGEELMRHDEPSPTRSSVLVRLGHSHVRFGVFQRLAFEKNPAAIKHLVDYCVDQFDPDLAGLPHPEKTVALFRRVVQRTARLASGWMAAGFVHGVLNTDNMNVTGESFDYGPWRFAPIADPSLTAAYFDENGIYAFGRQAEAAAWNLARLGGALTFVAPEGALNDALQVFSTTYPEAMADAFFARLGLLRTPTAPTDTGDFEFVIDFLRWMAESRAPFERVFFDWFCGRESEQRASASPIASCYDEPVFSKLRSQLMGFEPSAPERLGHAYFKNPAPCTMLIDEVEAIWDRIADGDDWTALNSKLEAIGQMRSALGFNASAYGAGAERGSRLPQATG